MIGLTFLKRLSFFVVMLAAIPSAQMARADLITSRAAENGRMFLINLFDPQLDLLPEYHGAKVYWLFHDNYLAAKILAASRPDLSEKIMAAIHREGGDQRSKAKILFGEAVAPLPFHDYQLVDVRNLTNKLIRTEIVTAHVMAGWTNYADLLLLASIAEHNPAKARADWNAAVRLWDGKGFCDAATRSGNLYSTYKLALAVLAADHLQPPAPLPSGLFSRLLKLQSPSGGWITDYTSSGKKVGLANVETTSLCILAVERRNVSKNNP